MVADVDGHLRAAAKALQGKEQSAGVRLVAGTVTGADDHGEVPVDPFSSCNFLYAVSKLARDDALLDPVFAQCVDDVSDAGLQVRVTSHHLVCTGNEVLSEGTHKLWGSRDAGYALKRGRHRKADRLSNSSIPGGGEAHLAKRVVHALNGSLRRVCECVVEIIENNTGPHSAPGV